MSVSSIAADKLTAGQLPYKVVKSKRGIGHPWNLVARINESADLRLQAVWKLSDETLLAELGKNALVELVRNAAAARLTELQAQGQPPGISSDR